jgi:lipopolysaccharide transport system ATP-binding protein
VTAAPLIAFDGVWKSYPRWAGGQRTLQGMLARRVPVLTRGGDRRWVLKDVSLGVGAGESLGIVGANGAGKSTLLRLASGLGRPTRGQIGVSGAVASVLSLGDTFDGSLTGRENALTAAIVAGVPGARARAALPAVLDFAELEAFADAPVRTYSEGMKLRLAFSVIAQSQPDVLLLDEVIAVGDLRFQDKCAERIAEMREAGAAVLFASHSLDQVEEECDRALWLQAGGVRASGEAGEVVEAYRSDMRSETLERTPAPAPAGEDEGASTLELRRNRFGTQEVVVEDVALVGPDERPVRELGTGAPLTVTLALRPRDAAVERVIVGVAIHRVADGTICYDASTEADGVDLGRVEDRLDVALVFERLDLLPGDYAVDVGVYAPDWAVAYDYHWQAYGLTVTGRGGDRGVFRPPHRWTVAR